LKRVLAPVLALLLLCLASCSSPEDDIYEEYAQMPRFRAGQNEQNKTMQPPEKTKRTLTVWIGKDPSEMESIAAAYEKEHPDVDVVVVNMNESGDYYEYWNKLATAVVGGTAADILEVEGLPIHRYIQNGMIMDLNTCIEADLLFDRSDYFDNVLRAYEVDGKLPYISTNFALYMVSMSKTVDSESYREFMASDVAGTYQIQRWFEKEVQKGTRNHYLVGTNLLQEGIVEWEWFEYFDIKAGIVRFTDPSIERYLSALDALMNRQEKWESFPLALKYQNGERFKDTYMLRYTPSPVLLLQRMLQYPDDCYSPPKLYASTGGKIQASIAPYGFSIPSSCTQSELAWDFIKHCLLFYQTDSVRYNDCGFFPLNRARCEYVLRNVAFPILRDSSRQILEEGDAANLDEAIATLMEMIDLVNYTPIHDRTFAGSMRQYVYQYVDGDITAHEASALLQEKGELYMHE